MSALIKKSKPNLINTKSDRDMPPKTSSQDQKHYLEK